jgi:hypothetical protein
VDGRSALALEAVGGAVDLGSLLSLAFLGLLLYRQRQVRPVPRSVRPRSSLVFGLIGLVVFVEFLNGGVTVGAVPWAILAASFALGIGLALVRAHTVRIWLRDRRLVRQGSWWTVALWVVAVVTHVVAGVLIVATGGPRGLGSATGMIYLAIASLAQQVAVVRRGREMRALAHAGQ